MEGDRIDVLDHGFVRLDATLADDLSVVNAARVSFGTRKEQMEDRDAGLIRFLMRERHGTPFEHNCFRYHIKCPLLVAREWQRHRIGCLTEDTVVTFVNTKGEQTPKLAKTMGELWTMWSEGELSGVAPDVALITEAIEMVNGGASIRAASRATGLARETISRRLKQDPATWSLRNGQWRVRGMNLRVMDEQTQEFTVGNVVDVIDQGMQPVYRLTLADGKQITLTENHQVLTGEGWRTMADAVGLSGRGENAEMTRAASLMVNGVAAYQDRDWVRSCRERGMSVAEIAEQAGCSYHTIRKWLRIHDLQFAPAERNFAPGQTPWNKGRPGYSTRLVVSDEHKAAIRAARSGERSNFWRGGVTSDRANIGRWTREQAARVHYQYDYTCQECQQSARELHAHHIVPVSLEPERARDVGNLISICKPCHRALHRTQAAELDFARRFAHRLGFARELEDVPQRKGVRLRAHPIAVVALEYVGIRRTFDLSVAAPWHNFVANGIVVHNSFNERSARYSEMPDELYLPAAEDVRTQVGKPGAYTFEQVDAELAAQTREDIDASYRASYDTYRALLERGIAKEVARTVLPVGLFTEFYWTVNARSLMHFVSLRAHETAQLEIRRYAEAVESLFARHMPVTHAAFEAGGRVSP